MGRPYLEKFADVKWENNEEHLEAWKKGKTGVPIVDAVGHSSTGSATKAHQRFSSGYASVA